MLKTARLTLRQPIPSDWDAFRDFMTSERANGVGGPRHAGLAWRQFASELGHWAIKGFGMWSVTHKDSDQNIGMIGPWCPVDWPENEVGWMIFDPKVEGTGVASEAARAAIDHAYDTLQWKTAVSYIAPDNARSIALAEKLGAARDDAATKPDRFPDTLVYRHPKVTS